MTAAEPVPRSLPQAHAGTLSPTGADGLVLAEGELHDAIETDASFWWLEDEAALKEFIGEVPSVSLGPGEHRHVLKLSLAKRKLRIWARMWSGEVDEAEQDLDDIARRRQEKSRGGDQAAASGRSGGVGG